MCCAIAFCVGPLWLAVGSQSLVAASTTDGEGSSEEALPDSQKTAVLRSKRWRSGRRHRGNSKAEAADHAVAYVQLASQAKTKFFPELMRMGAATIGQAINPRMSPVDIPGLTPKMAGTAGMGMPTPTVQSMALRAAAERARAIGGMCVLTIMAALSVARHVAVE